MSYEEFKKLVIKYCREDSFNAFPEDRRDKEIAQTIKENEDVIEERYKQLTDYDGEDPDSNMCREHAEDIAGILRWLW